MFLVLFFIFSGNFPSCLPVMVAPTGLHTKSPHRRYETGATQICDWAACFSHRMFPASLRRSWREVKWPNAANAEVEIFDLLTQNGVTLGGRQPMSLEMLLPSSLTSRSSHPGSSSCRGRWNSPSCLRLFSTNTTALGGPTWVELLQQVQSC